MARTEQDIDRALLLLRNKIRERGFTQLEVQDSLKWGRSYISQLLTKQKTLRLEQILKILEVIAVDRAEFFAELFPLDPSSFGARSYAGGGPRFGHQPRGAADEEANARPELSRSVLELRALVRGLSDLLIERRLVSADELRKAIEAADSEPP